MVYKLEKEYRYYQENKSSLLLKYNGKYVAIKDGKVVVEGSSKTETVQNMLDAGHNLGEFLVQRVSEDSDKGLRFYSRIT